MAVYNEIGIGRWNRFIQKLTDIKGSPPARQLASEIVFHHGIFSGEENRYLESWDLFGVGATLSQALVSIPMETRGRAASTCLASFNAAALTTLNVIAQGPLLANTLLDFIGDGIQEISLPPGSAVQIDGQGANIALAVSFWWRERFLEPAERS